MLSEPIIVSKMKKQLIRIILTAVLLLAAYLVERNVALPQWQVLLVYLVPYLIIGHGVLAEACEGIAKGDPFDENFLMAVATIGALLIGFLPGAEPQYAEAVMVMLFFQIGELFEHIAEHRSREAVSDLMDLRPDIAHVVQDGEVSTVGPEVVRVGDVIEIRPGEKVPVDGEVLSGNSSLDTVALTGESLPRSVSPGDSVISGSVNLSGVLRAKVLKSFGDSTAAKILDLVEHASENKSHGETFITRFARVYTPIVVFAALAVAVIPPLFADSYIESFSVWLYRALTFLVISCPCALVISVPLTFFAGIGGASRKGILIKGGNYIDMLAKLDTVVFDKTGTLTRGKFEVTAVHQKELPDCKSGRTETELLHLAAHVERYSTHPIAQSLRDAYPNEQDGCSVEDVEEIAGHGIRAKVNNDIVCVGNERMMESIGAKWRPCHHVGTIIHVAVNGEYAGHIVIADSPKADAKETIDRLRGLGVRRLVMLTGDIDAVGKDVADRLGLDAYYARLLPADKVTHVERLSRECYSGGGCLAFVGDGINDAPVLARADIGIAMGALGSDAAIEVADIVLMDDKPSRIADAIKIARRTLSIAWQNTWFSIAIKVAVLLLAAFGLAGMGLAVFADVGVMVLAVLNAMRALR